MSPRGKIAPIYMPTTGSVDVTGRSLRGKDWLRLIGPLLVVWGSMIVGTILGLGGRVFDALYLSLAGTPVQGRVVDHRIGHTVGRHATTVYQLEYEFPWNGQTIRDEGRTTLNGYNRFGHAGVLVPLRVKDLWGEPRTCVAFDMSRERTVDLILIGISVLAGIGLSLLALKRGRARTAA